MLCDSDISILFQGKYEPQDTTDSIRQTIISFPQSQIIISCWKGDDIPDEILKLPNVKIIINDDVKPPEIKGAKTNNVNRQLRTTISGLDVVRTKYVIKLRSDCCLGSNKIIDIYSRKATVGFNFDKKILILNLTSHSHNNNKLLFHPCDWIYFGLTKDVKELFSVEYQSLDDFDYYKNGKLYCSKFRVEQYFYVKHLENNGVRSITHAHDYNCDLVRTSIDNIMNDFIIVNPLMISLRSFKHKHLWKYRRHVYSHFDWCKYHGIKNEDILNIIVEKFIQLLSVVRGLMRKCLKI
ncbi:hypothetical protein MOS07_000584 [Vibrio vulnificus]|nr:hypothetical protein [Vibrio vulnificus]